MALATGGCQDELVERYARAWAHQAGAHFVRLLVDPEDVPPRRDRSGRLIEASFVATPPALRRAWRVARRVRQNARGGDVVVASDAEGLAAVCALDSWSLEPPERWHVVIVAGGSQLLHHLWVSGTSGPFEQDDIDDVIDLERTALQHAMHVVTPSAVAAELLAGEGIVAELASWERRSENDATDAFLARPLDRWFLAEPFSRRARTLEVLRAAATCPDPPAVRLPDETEDDPYWHGSTAHAFTQVVQALQPVTSPDEDHDVVILGDPFRLPSVAEQHLSTPVIVQAGSTASVASPGAFEWRTEEDLVAARTGSLVRYTAPLAQARLPTPASGESERASSVSVVVPVFRDVRFLSECVGSVLSQTVAAHEIILVDDGSRSRAVDEAFDELVGRSPGLVKPVKLRANRGVSVARNTGMTQATGDTVLFIDQDDVAEPEFIERTTNVLRARPDLAGVATWTRFVGAYEGIEAKPAFDRRSGWRQNTVVSTAALLDLAFLREVGIRFEPTLSWIYCEDWDLWAQVIAAGGRLGLVAEPLMLHRVHRSSGGFTRRALAVGAGRGRVRDRLQSPVPATGHSRTYRHPVELE